MLCFHFMNDNYRTDISDNEYNLLVSIFCFLFGDVQMREFVQRD